MIKLQVIGNLGKDCTTNTVNGKTVMNFNVAHTERFRDASGQQKDKTTWAQSLQSPSFECFTYISNATHVFSAALCSAFFLLKPCPNPYGSSFTKT